MKNLIIFLFGAAVGAGGAIIWLRKDIQKQLSEIRENSTANESTKAAEDVPFSVNDIPRKVTHKQQEPIQYNKIPLAKDETMKISSVSDNNGEHVVEDDPGFATDETDGGIYEIDMGEFKDNDRYTKDHLVYYRGDKVMATENGTVIKNPFPMIGGNWENCVGNYAERTAFIRNPKMLTDYEIYVEDCMYSDEFGSLEDEL